MKTFLKAALFATLLSVATGCSDPKEGKDCKQAHWLEESKIRKGDPGVGRHSVGAHPAGCYRSEIEGMNTRLVPLDPVCCGR